MSDVVRDLAADNEALIHFLYIAPIGLAQATHDGEIVMMNPISAQLLMPLAKGGDLSNLFAALESVAPDLEHRVADFAPASGLVCDGMRIFIDAGTRGNSEHQVLSLSLLKLDAVLLMAVLSDITQQVKREKLLRQNEAWLNAIMTGVRDFALISLDQNGCVDDWNESIGRVTGYPREAVIGRPYSLFYSPGCTTPDRITDRLHEADTNGWSLDDGWRSRADGTRFWGSALISPLRIDNETVLAVGEPGEQAAYCLVIRDITDRREEIENLHKNTSCDHLTGLVNRRMFFEAAEIELGRWKRRPRPIAIVMFDADHFKRVNDTHGHPAGDAVLRNLAATLKATFRDCDVVARIGGEEFAVLLPSTGAVGALAVANRFLQAVAAQRVQVDGAEIRYTVSGGIACMDETVADLGALMKRADKALYAAKAAGRNQVAVGSG